MNKSVRQLITVIATCALLYFVYNSFFKYFNETRVLKQIIERLEADTRIAEVLVTQSKFDETTGKVLTTIKFLEYDVLGRPLKPKYFTFAGNIIQFQSLVIRFSDMKVRMADKLKGRSAYLFWKVFMLDGNNTREYTITPIDTTPEGYKILGEKSEFESRLWKKFWKYALDPKARGKMDVKNAQIEAPGTMFLPGYLYNIKIEHDGGMRIDSVSIPGILKGETIPSEDR